MKPLHVFFQFLMLFIILGVAPFFYSIYSYQELRHEHHARIEQDNFNHLQYSAQGLQHFVTKLQTSISILGRSNQLELTAQQLTPQNVELIHDFWRLSLESLNIYSQLRLLDTNGLEVIRVNHNEGTPYIVPKSELQDKSHRNYFTYAKTLERGEIGRFGIDFEVENRQLVYPLIPSMRLIYPIDVEDANNGTWERLGYFIANVDLRYIYESLVYETSNYRPLVISEMGEVILGHESQPEFTSMYPNNAELTFARAQSELWEKMSAEGSGSYFDGEQWYVYSRFNIATSAPTHSQPRKAIYLLFAGQDPEMNDIYDEALEALIEHAISLFIIVFLVAAGFTIWNFNHKKNSMESQLARAAMNGMSALLITDKRNRIVKINQQFTELSGYELSDVLGKQPDIFTSGKHNQEFYIAMWKSLKQDGFWEGEIITRSKQGKHIDQILRLQTVTDKHGDIQYYVASFVDITERKLLENKLRDLSERDTLTHSWNRRKFESELNTLTAKRARYPDKEQTCLAIIDIDFFKRINDKLGHDVGDSVIRSVARVLEDGVRDTDFVARVGGEEFAILLPHTPLEEAEIVLNRLRVAVELEHQNTVTVSGGVTQLCHLANESYKRADLALYDAKSSGRNQIKTLSQEEACEFA